MRFIPLIAGFLLIGIFSQPASAAVVFSGIAALRPGEAGSEQWTEGSVPQKRNFSRSQRLPLADHSLSVGGLSERVYHGLLPSEGVPVSYPAFANRRGRTECVELIKGLLGAPATTLWREGRKLKADLWQIQPGTAIATFVNGRYPNWERRGSKHAAIFLRADEQGIYVLDQFAHQGGVKQRFIPWRHPQDRRPANNAEAYSTVRW